MAHGKRYRAAVASYSRDESFSPTDAVTLVKEHATAKFDETVELHIRTGLDPRHAEQQVRGTALLPNGLGKQVRILVFAEGEAARTATESGADEVGGDDLIKRVADGFTDFDVALAQRELMGKVGKLGRILGPRGLMPNPKAGTVVDGADLPQAIHEARQGRVEFRLDRLALIHVPIGKASFAQEHLVENLLTTIQEIVKAKPKETKGSYIRSMYLTSTMGPSVKLELQTSLSMKAE